jgi:hypothetical protein
MFNWANGPFLAYTYLRVAAKEKISSRLPTGKEMMLLIVCIVYFYLSEAQIAVTF